MIDSHMSSHMGREYVEGAGVAQQAQCCVGRAIDKLDNESRPQVRPAVATWSSAEAACSMYFTIRIPYQDPEFRTEEVRLRRLFFPVEQMKGPKRAMVFPT